MFFFEFLFPCGNRNRKNKMKCSMSITLLDFGDLGLKIGGIDVYSSIDIANRK